MTTIVSVDKHLPETGHGQGSPSSGIDGVTSHRDGFPCSIAPFPGQEKYAYWGGGNRGEAMTWHNEFTETVQADWVESVYTIAYCKPWVEAISYGDFKGHDGFVTTEGKPRESYHRLRALLAKWRDEG